MRLFSCDLCGKPIGTNVSPYNLPKGAIPFTDLDTNGVQLALPHTEKNASILGFRCTDLCRYCAEALAKWLEEKKKA